MAAHEAPPPLGFSRQEHWSGLPFPSPMHESEKWKWSRWVLSDSYRPHGLRPTRLLHPWDSRQEYWSGVPLPSPKQGLTHSKYEWMNEWIHMNAAFFSAISECWLTPLIFYGSQISHKSVFAFDWVHLGKQMRLYPCVSSELNLEHMRLSISSKSNSSIFFSFPLSLIVQGIHRWS